MRGVEIPGAKATVVHELGSGRVFKREGKVIRLLGDVNPSGRMARVLVVIYDPLGLENPQYREHPLLLSTYVRVNLQGPTLHNVFVVPREAIRQKDNVWIKTADSELEIRKVNIVYRGKETVIVDQGLQEGEEIVVINPDGTKVELEDIATLKESFEDVDTEAYFNGQRAVRVDVFRVGDQTPIDISEKVNQYVEKINKTLPTGVSIATWNDRAEIYRDRIHLLVKKLFWD